MSDEHVPVRPSWTCAGCDEAWPCAPALEKLCADYGDQKVNLAIYMATQLGHAAGDLTEATPIQLYERFIAWTRPDRLDVDDAATIG